MTSSGSSTRGWRKRRSRATPLARAACSTPPRGSRPNASTRSEPRSSCIGERPHRCLAAGRRHEQRISLWTGEASRVPATQARVAALRRAARIAEEDLGRPDLALVELRAAWSIDPDDGEVADSIVRLLTPMSPPHPDDPADPARARARIDFYAEAAAKTEDPQRKIAHLEKLAQIWEDEVRVP